MSLPRGTLSFVGVVLAVLLAWWLLTGLSDIDAFLLPAPPAVGRALVGIIGDPDTYSHVATTLGEIAGAFLIAATLGLLVGFPVGWYRRLRRAYEPLLANLYAIPIVVFYPVLILVLGLGPASKIGFGAIYAFFPIAIATLWGISDTNPTLVAAGRSMGARGLSLFRVVVVPAALPRIMGGLRLGLVLATLSVVGGEFIGGKKGLGYLLATSGQAFQTVEMFAYVVLTLVLAAVLNAALAAVDLAVTRRLT